MVVGVINGNLVSALQYLPESLLVGYWRCRLHKYWGDTRKY